MHSGYQKIEILESIYNKQFYKKTIPQLEFIRKEGERGIIFGERGFLEEGHVFNVIKKDGKLIFKDGQIAKNANLRDGFVSFKYLKTN